MRARRGLDPTLESSHTHSRITHSKIHAMNLRFRHLFTTRRTLGRVLYRRQHALGAKHVSAPRARGIHVRLQTHRALPPRPPAPILRPRARGDASVHHYLRPPSRPSSRRRRASPRRASRGRPRQHDRSRRRLANDDDVAPRPSSSSSLSSSSLIGRPRRFRRRRRPSRLILPVAHEHHRPSSRRARAPVRPTPRSLKMIVAAREIDRERAGRHHRAGGTRRALTRAVPHFSSRARCAR